MSLITRLVGIYFIMVGVIALLGVIIEPAMHPLATAQVGEGMKIDSTFAILFVALFPYYLLQNLFATLFNVSGTSSNVGVYFMNYITPIILIVLGWWIYKKGEDVG
jgi:hypothetical protein